MEGVRGEKLEISLSSGILLREYNYDSHGELIFLKDSREICRLKKSVGDIRKVRSPIKKFSQEYLKSLLFQVEDVLGREVIEKGLSIRV